MTGFNFKRKVTNHKFVQEMLYQIDYISKVSKTYLFQSYLARTSTFLEIYFFKLIISELSLILQQLMVLFTSCVVKSLKAFHLILSIF